MLLIFEVAFIGVPGAVVIFCCNGTGTGVVTEVVIFCCNGTGTGVVIEVVSGVGSTNVSAIVNFERSIESLFKG